MSSIPHSPADNAPDTAGEAAPPAASATPAFSPLYQQIKGLIMNSL